MQRNSHRQLCALLLLPYNSRLIGRTDSRFNSCARVVKDKTLDKRENNNLVFIGQRIFLAVQKDQIP